MIVFTIAAYTAAIAIAVPLLVLAAECLLALLPPRRLPMGQRKRCAVLVPAHDEATGIAATLNNINQQLRQDDRLIVVADNCSDCTAEIAERHGAEVVVRHDLQRRGKGYALQAGIDHLKRAVASGTPAPDVVVVQDADCMFGSEALKSLVRAADGVDHPVQARYLMHASRGATPKQRISAFAFLVKNWVRPRGLSRLNLPVQLTGSGMAFPWHLISGLELGTSQIVEDMELGLKLVQDGTGPRFCELATVESSFPDSAEAASQQRKRWEHGHLGQMKRMLPPLLSKSLTGNLRALAMGLDLTVPPVSLLAMTTVAVLLMIAGFAVVSSVVGPLLICAFAATLAGLGLALTWYRFGRTSLSLREIAWVPAYAGKKLTMYAAAAFRAESQWKRTERTT